jgi:hypothetical protein
MRAMVPGKTRAGKGRARHGKALVDHEALAKDRQLRAPSIELLEHYERALHHFREDMALLQQTRQVRYCRACSTVTVLVPAPRQCSSPRGEPEFSRGRIASTGGPRAGSGRGRQSASARAGGRASWCGAWLEGNGGVGDPRRRRRPEPPYLRPPDLREPELT